MSGFCHSLNNHMTREHLGVVHILRNQPGGGGFQMLVQYDPGITTSQELTTLLQCEWEFQHYFSRWSEDISGAIVNLYLTKEDYCMELYYCMKLYKHWKELEGGS